MIKILRRAVNTLWVWISGNLNWLFAVVSAKISIAFFYIKKIFFGFCYFISLFITSLIKVLALVWGFISLKLLDWLKSIYKRFKKNISNIIAESIIATFLLPLCDVYKKKGFSETIMLIKIKIKKVFTNFLFIKCCYTERAIFPFFYSFFFSKNYKNYREFIFNFINLFFFISLILAFWRRFDLFSFRSSSKRENSRYTSFVKSIWNWYWDYEKSHTTYDLISSLIFLFLYANLLYFLLKKNSEGFYSVKKIFYFLFFNFPQKLKKKIRRKKKENLFKKMRK